MSVSVAYARLVAPIYGMTYVEGLDHFAEMQSGDPLRISAAKEKQRAIMMREAKQNDHDVCPLCGAKS